MKSIVLSRIWSYLLVGRLLHLITIIEIVGIFVFLPIIFRIETNHSVGLFCLKIYLAGYLLSLPFFSQLDARSRFQNYKQIKDQFYTYGFNSRILNPVLKSRCQRDAALISAKELGMYDSCKSFFHDHGYRWYHIIPDFVFRRPQFLVTKYFWRTTFFAPTYQSKIDYSSISPSEVQHDFINYPLNIDSA
jgi:hypothetical protein